MEALEADLDSCLDIGLDLVADRRPDMGDLHPENASLDPPPLDFDFFVLLTCLRFLAWELCAISS
jgi:hypothetical protein